MSDNISNDEIEEVMEMPTGAGEDPKKVNWSEAAKDTTYCSDGEDPDDDGSLHDMAGKNMEVSHIIKNAQARTLQGLEEVIGDNSRILDKVTALDDKVDRAIELFTACQNMMHRVLLEQQKNSYKDTTSKKSNKPYSKEDKECYDAMSEEFQITGADKKTFTVLVSAEVLKKYGYTLGFSMSRKTGHPIDKLVSDMKARQDTDKESCSVPEFLKLALNVLEQYVTEIPESIEQHIKTLDTTI